MIILDPTWLAQYLLTVIRTTDSLVIKEEEEVVERPRERERERERTASFSETNHCRSRERTKIRKIFWVERK